MKNKIRGCMGKRDDKYILKGSLEMDDGFVSVVHKEGTSNEEETNIGRGSQKKRSILMMVETVNLSTQKPIEKQANQSTSNL